jgi:flagellar hook-associated protein 1 FlgK
MIMAGLSSALETAKSALWTQEIAIDVASHNVANAGNSSYSRQSASIVTAPPTRTSAGWIGNGTTIATITQSRDAYVDRQVILGTSQQADYQTQSSLLSPVASFLQDNGSTGLSDALGAFWDSWDSLSQNPGGATEKQNVVTTATNLVDSIQSSYATLTSQGDDLKTQVSDNVHKINTLLKQIADINQQISNSETPTQKANDLRDMRYQALQDLSGYIGIDYSEGSNGSFTVSVTDGSSITLVDNGHYGSLDDDISGEPKISYTDASGTVHSPTTNNISGGSLAGELAVWKSAFSPTNTSSYASMLNTFASNLVSSVNTTYGASVFTAGTDASDISVDSTFTAATVNSANATAVADVQNTSQTALGNRTFGEYLSYIQQQIGSDVQNASTQSDFQKALVSQLQTQQQSISGVSIDEEMINLLKSQQIYQAASKVVTATRDMMNAIIGMV